MNLPGDPVMLLSVINTLLRDQYDSLEELCASCMVDETMIVNSLAAIDYHYDPSHNKFI